ncbi:MAG TPA: twin-arginine translocation signal domain-containing protein [Symbiobacteriaceae bacterium]|nr:twin-arginine translocation signal domain-containing protein [Symbiobacteriaceae bacterium]
MTLTRRDLLKKGAAAGSLLAFVDTVTGEAAASQGLKTGETKETKTICPYCSVGCGITLSTRDGELVNAQGDLDHPINEGSLCSKGSSVMNLRLVADKDGKYTPNPRRVQKVLYRAPYASKWEEKDWDWALAQIARKVKETRDATFEQKDSNGVTVNRTFAISHIGSAALDNEENYALHKMMRALGVVRLEHHARL